MAKKNPFFFLNFRLHKLYFYIMILISAFKSATSRKSYIHLPLILTNRNHIKNGNSCTDSILCETSIIFISKRQQPTEKNKTGYFISNCFFNKKQNWFRLVFDMYESPPCLIFKKDYYLKTFIISKHRAGRITFVI